MKKPIVWISAVGAVLTAIVLIAVFFSGREESFPPAPPDEPVAVAAPPVKSNEDFSDGCSFHPPPGPILTAAKMKNYSFQHSPSSRTETGALENGTIVSISANGCEDFINESVSIEVPNVADRSPQEWFQWAKDEFARLPFASEDRPTEDSQEFLSQRLPELEFDSLESSQEVVICKNGNQPNGPACKDSSGNEAPCPSECGWEDGGTTRFRIERVIDNSGGGKVRLTFSESSSA